MTTRRSRNAEHGLEKRGKPILLPILIALIALGAWFADRQPSTAITTPVASSEAIGQGEIAVSAISGIDNGTAVTCFTHPLITLCNRLTQERR